VAIIKAHGNDFRALTLGDSDRLQVGEEVVAIGSPLSLESTVSNGIVSGIRTVEKEGGKFLQITAPISPGSSGGPLFNMTGEVVGITTSHLVGGESLNFAIPINDVKPMLLARPSKARSLPYEARPVMAGPATGDSLSETLAWMHTTINKGDLENSSGFGEAEVTQLSYSSCNVHITRSEKTKINGEVINRIDWFFNLKDIDPNSVTLEVPEASDNGFGIIGFHTTNDRDGYTVLAITAKYTYSHSAESSPEPAYGGDIVLYDAAYALRFKRAFQRAVELCGGKPSNP
jgi:hypothetical protein